LVIIEHGSCIAQLNYETVQQSSAPIAGKHVTTTFKTTNI